MPAGKASRPTAKYDSCFILPVPCLCVVVRSNLRVSLCMIVSPSLVCLLIICMCRAMYDYTAATDDELSFQEGDTIFIVQKDSGGWWEGNN